MIPQGWRTARSTCAALRPRPARSGPNMPSALTPWQLRQAVARGASRSQKALPAAASPAGAAPCAAARLGASGSSRQAKSIFFMDPILPVDADIAAGFAMIAYTLARVPQTSPKDRKRPQRPRTEAAGPGRAAQRRIDATQGDDFLRADRLGGYACPQPRGPGHAGRDRPVGHRRR